MELGNFALFLVLLGALCSCASGYYFPAEGPPVNRLSRQAAPPGSVVTVHPEPRERKPTAVPTLTFDVPSNDSVDVGTVKPEPRDLNVPPQPEKPEPREFLGVQMVPRRKDPIDSQRQLRQTNRCSQNYAFSQPGESVVLQSPNYPREYPNNVQSATCFTSPSGTTMQISCDEFNVENHRSCQYDYLGIALDGNPSSIQKYCGRGTLNSPASSGNSLAVVFKSDSSNPSSTRRSPYRFRCSITVSGSSGNNPGTSTTTARPPSGNCTCGRRNDGRILPPPRIVGGNDAKVNEFPWRCYMKTKTYSFFCGCSVISPTWVLTAAHCTAAVMPLKDGDELYVVVGDHDRSITTEAASQQIVVEKVYDDPQYDDKTMDHDVSLLKLSRAITYNNAISPVCLPFNYVNDEFQDTTVTASGWGTTSQGGQTSNKLKEVDLPVLTTAQCSNYYRGQITERMICTYNPGKDTCQGDSGGSIDLFRNGRYYHIGVVSWGVGCAQQNRPGVYAKTTKFLDWIVQTTGESFCRV